MINIKYKNDLISIDKRLSQVRYLKDISKQGEIIFLNLQSYKFDEYGFNYIEKDLRYFLKCVRWFILNELNIKLTLKEMELLK